MSEAGHYGHGVADALWMFKCLVQLFGRIVEDRTGCVGCRGFVMVPWVSEIVLLGFGLCTNVAGWW